MLVTMVDVWPMDMRMDDRFMQMAVSMWFCSIRARMLMLMMFVVDVNMGMS